MLILSEAGFCTGGGLQRNPQMLLYWGSVYIDFSIQLILTSPSDCVEKLGPLRKRQSL